MNKKKDILFLCQYFYPEYISSATLPFDTAVSLTKEGYSVSALCGYPREYNLKERVPQREIHENIEIKRLKYLQLKRSNFIGRLINYFSFTFVVLLHFFELKNYKSIIVYSNPPILPFVAALSNKFFKTKIIFVSYDVYPEIAIVTNTISRDSLISKMMITINKIIFKRVNKVVALSNEMKNFLLKNRSSLKEHQVKVIPNWYEDKGIQKNEIQSETFRTLRERKRMVVSYFGNMGISQDIDTIIDTIRILRDDSQIQFVFAGHGNKMEILKNTIRKEQLENVVVFDFLHGQEFQDALNISDCFIVSLADGLTGMAVPSKTYSYMMAGKPVISIIGEESDIAKDLKENNAGYSIQVGQSIKMAEVIRELSVNPEKKRVMGENCRNVYLEKYTKEKCTKQYVEMMREILED